MQLKTVQGKQLLAQIIQETWLIEVQGCHNLAGLGHRASHIYSHLPRWSRPMQGWQDQSDASTYIF